MEYPVRMAKFGNVSEVDLFFVSLIHPHELWSYHHELWSILLELLRPAARFSAAVR